MNITYQNIKFIPFIIIAVALANKGAPLLWPVLSLLYGMIPFNLTINKKKYKL